MSVDIKSQYAIETDVHEIEGIIPKGTEMVIPYAWGYDEDEVMTNPTRYSVVLDYPMSIVSAIDKVMQVYLGSVAHPRYYYVEDVTGSIANGFELVLGT